MNPPSRMQQIVAMLESEPNDPELRYMQAMEFVSLGDDASAARCFQDLTIVDPKYAPAYHMGARTLSRLNRIEEAKAMLLRGIPMATSIGNTHAAGEMQELLESLE